MVGAVSNGADAVRLETAPTGCGGSAALLSRFTFHASIRFNLRFGQLTHRTPLECIICAHSPSIDIPLLWSEKQTQDCRLWKIDLQASGAQSNPIPYPRGLGDPTPTKIWRLGGRGRMPLLRGVDWQTTPLNPPTPLTRGEDKRGSSPLSFPSYQRGSGGLSPLLPFSFPNPVNP